MNKNIKNCTSVLKAKAKLAKSLEQALYSYKYGERRSGLNANERLLLCAVGINNTDLVKRLLKININPNIVDKQQRSALHLAVSRSYTDIVRLLLQNKANPHLQDIIGNTPLHLAACTCNIQIVRLLLDFGADVRASDLCGRSPLQLAESKLQILKNTWKSGPVEAINLGDQMQEVVDLMIAAGEIASTITPRLEVTEMWSSDINLDIHDCADDQMNRLQEELGEVSLK